MTLMYSKPINPRVGSSRISNRVFRGDLLGRSIQLYRMWFLFLKLGLDCEDNNVSITDHVKKKNIKVKVDKKFYLKWDLDRVKEDRFDDWWKDKKHLFIETEPSLVNEIEDDDNYYYIKVDKRSKREDVIRTIRGLIKSPKSFTSEFSITKQHKYVPTHMKYNVFIWRTLGMTNNELIKKLTSSYKFYEVRIPQEKSSIRRVLRSSEDLILSTCKGLF